ncbi:MAG: ATP-binding protein [Paludibacteraceae bacterium]|nr:ATP-binding protein [Paludibacteraceae bacterium]
MNKNKDSIYDFNKLKESPFAPSTEDELLDEYADLLVRYQSFRNGNSDKLDSASNLDEFKKTNEEVRREFLRQNHHECSHRYVMHLEKCFKSKNGCQGLDIASRIAEDLANICKAHGENLSFLETELENAAQYDERQVVNLQFVAEMVRLGDIIHFSKDRTPVVLQSAIDFKSSFSQGQWDIKSETQLKYEIKDGTIIFTTDKIKKPGHYYTLKDYIGWVNGEIDNYIRLSRNWDEKYKFDIKVNDKGIKYDSKHFTPASGNGFTLNQKRIIELLMGVELYKDKYACLRELYQNSLDACRCRMAKDETENIKRDGVIEFGIENRKYGRYLYCMDNGTGMTKEIIEKYLLHIGTSYYKSADFRRQQAEDGHSFTPVSQFGIGILSCFMIGTEIEIVTKTRDANECIALTIENERECMYYKPARENDVEKIKRNGNIGTIIWVKLKDYDKLSVGKLEKTWAISEFNYYDNIDNIPGKLKEYYKLYHNHLYRYLDEYIVVVPEGITVKVKTDDGNTTNIVSKPYQLKIGELGLSDTDMQNIFALHNEDATEYNIWYDQLVANIKTYPININTEDVEFRTFISLPLSSNYDSIQPYMNRNGEAVDGISVKQGEYYDIFEIRLNLHKEGVLNFVGNNRPQLSIDRQRIVYYPEEIGKIMENVAEEYIKTVIDIAKKHIKDNHLQDDNDTVLAVKRQVFEQLENYTGFYVNRLADGEYGNFDWENLSGILGQKTTIREFMKMKKIIVKNYDYREFDKLTKSLFKAKFLTADSVKINEDNELTIECQGNPTIPDNFINYESYLLLTDDEAINFGEYDLRTNLYPLVSKRLADWVENDEIIFTKGNNMVLKGYFGRLTLASTINDSFNESLINPYNYHNTFKNTLYYGVNLSILEGKSLMSFIFISPSILTDKASKELEKIKEDFPEYYKGVKEGWSVFVTDGECVIYKPGIWKRDDLLKEVPSYFWEENKDEKFVFSDGTECKCP